MIREMRIIEDLKAMGYDAQIYNVYKNNIEQAGIIISSNEGSEVVVSPIIYDAESAEDAIEKYESYLSVINDPSKEFFTKEYILENVRLGVYRYIGNEDMLDDLATLPISQTDLRLYFYCRIPKNLRFKITKSALEAFDLTEEDLFKAAKDHEEYVVRSMFDLYGFFIPDDCGMRILTNSEVYYGASVLCDTDLLNRVLQLYFRSEKMYIIPSSVHEVICISSDAKDSFNELNEMIRDVNKSFVRPEDQLSDHYYIFEGGELGSDDG